LLWKVIMAGHRRQEPRALITSIDGIFRLNPPRGGDTWMFGQSSLRNLLLESVDSSQAYIFMSTKANPRAAELLAQEGRRRAHHNKPFYFTNALMDTYLEAVTEQAKGAGISIVSYDIVHYKSPGGCVHHEAPLWPVIHVLPGYDSDRFERIVKELHTDAGYEAFRKADAPNHVCARLADFLRKRKILPLSIERHVTMGGEALRQVVNLICTFEYSRINEREED
jgi:hypothetical protein